MDADVIVIGGGLAGLVTTAELVEAGKRVILIEQEPYLGGQAHWSFGGLFLIDSPEQRRMGVKDSPARASSDWMNAADFDDDGSDTWPRRWAEAYLDFAAGEKRAWLHGLGVRFFPVVGWAERGLNSVPRFHIIWGTGPRLVEVFEGRVRGAAASGLVRLAMRHRVDELTTTDGTVDGVRGSVLEPSAAERGTASSRTQTGEFTFSAGAVVVTSGGIGGDFDLVRKNWPTRLGNPPSSMLSGVPEHVDGRMLGITEAAGGHLINRDRMWHYTEGITNWNPIWPSHGVRILPGPSSIWLDAAGHRMPATTLPGFDNLGALKYVLSTGYDYSWFVLNQRIIEKEFALSGSEQNPDLTNRKVRMVLKRVLPGATGPVEAFKEKGADFVVADSLDELVAGMNARTDDALLDPDLIRAQIEARDAEVDNPSTADLQVEAIRRARRYRGDRLIRVAPPHRLLDPKASPLIAVKLHILTRKTLGGLETDLSGRVMQASGAPLPGLYAAGEVAGFGGGGMHGHRSLEGTFLGGCLFSGRTVARALAAATTT